MKKYVLVIDCEACPWIKSDKVDGKNCLAYDIGFALMCPRTKEVILRRSYVVQEIFFGETDKMQSAYYANKLPRYFTDIANGSRVVKSLFDILNEINEICKQYNVVAICAHNAKFDVSCLNATVNYLMGTYNVHALPNIEIWDSMRMWSAVKPKAYKKYCEQNNYLTPTKRAKLTAEVIYKYISNNPDFKESHTGLEDVNIEMQIVFKCYDTHKKLAEKRVLYKKI